MNHSRTWLAALLVAVTASFSVAICATAEAATPFTAISASGTHTCAVTDAGGLMCWGNNAWGAVGDGTTIDRYVPVAVTGLSTGVVAVTTGSGYSCALTSGGGVVCWGLNHFGQLGDGTTTDHLTPMPVTGLSSGVTAIAAGNHHTCAVTSAGAVLCWGSNGHGNLGDGTTTMRLTPVAVSGLPSPAIAIAVSGSYTCALSTVGGVVCWGDNRFGQLGDGTSTERHTPVAVVGLSSGITALTAGGANTCVVTGMGAALCWGDGRKTPTAVNGLSSGVTAVAAGLQFTCALTTGGAAQCWGANIYGQLGDGTTIGRSSPALVNGLSSGITAIAAGYFHACALRNDGRALCWGYNASGQIGNNTRINRRTPVLVGPSPPAITSQPKSVSADAGQTVTFSTAADGFPVATFQWQGLFPGDTTWTNLTDTGPYGGTTSTLLTVTSVTEALHGAQYRAVVTNSEGTATTNTATLNVSTVGGQGTVATALAAGHGHTCAISGGGGVQCWGGNSGGQLGDGTRTDRSTPVAATGVPVGPAAIAAGGSQTCVSFSGGYDWCWGDVDGRRVVPPYVPFSEPSTAVAAGSHHICGLTTAGGVRCRGQNHLGQLGDGTTTERNGPVQVVGLSSGIIAITAGASHTCALTSAGGVLCWGFNVSGQLGNGTTTNSSTPVPVSGLSSGVIALDADTYYTCALTSAGGVLCWGLGLGESTGTGHLVPVPVSGLSTGITAIAAGGNHACVLNGGGGVLCWGSNQVGQLGTSAPEDRSTPAAVSSLATGVVALAAGSQHTCALIAGGSIACWGTNVNGQLGTGDATVPASATPLVLEMSVPAITSHPASAAVQVGQTATFQVSVTGSPALAFQWQVLNGSTWTNVTSSTPFSGTTTATLTITNAPATLTGNRFRVLVTNLFGTATSNAATLMVGPPAAPTITTQPTRRVIASGQIGSFSVEASGNLPPTYQWQVLPVSAGTWTNVVDDAQYSGSTTSALTIVNTTVSLNGYQFRAVATNSGGAATSNAALLTVTAMLPVPADFDGDGKTDITVHRPSTGEWYVLQSSTALSTYSLRQWGLPGDVHVNGDFDGDRQADPAIYRRNPGHVSEWYVLLSATGLTSYAHYYFGLDGDVPVPDDYDGDGQTDAAVYRPIDGTWHVVRSSVTGPAAYVIYPRVTSSVYRLDYPVPADYDGDGKADPAVFRRATATWYFRLSTTSFGAITSTVWGTGAGRPVPSDYDGDGKADLAVYRPSSGTWSIQPSNGAPAISQSWGQPGDVVVPGDYDADGQTDLAFYRPADGYWHVLTSSSAYSASIVQQWGLDGDLAVPNAVLANIQSRINRFRDVIRASDFDGDSRSDIIVFRPSNGTWYVRHSSADFAPAATYSWGLDGDVAVPGDYNGDGVTDPAVWRPGEGRWYIYGNPVGTQWGLTGDIPISVDLRGAGVSNLAVYRPAGPFGPGWYVISEGKLPRCSPGGCAALAGVTPVPADYDADGQADLALYDLSTGVWKINPSGDQPDLTYQLGVPGDIPVPADYDGDGAADIAVFRPSTGTWHIRLSSTGYATTQSFAWGVNSDIPVPGDYDGDGVTDIAVYHPPTAVWSILKSSSNFTQSVSYQWGLPGDIPILGRQ
jgi:alpha-tubulin suppressor-like RCC1 family protein